MPSYGLTSAGFIPKRLDEIIASLEAGMVGIFGTNTDVDPDSPDGQIIGLFAGALAEVWDAVEELATVFDPTSVTGTLQSRQVLLNGITRIAEASTIVAAEVVGLVPFSLPIGTLAETATGDRFKLLAPVTFTGGSDSSLWQAESPGPVPCAAGTLTVITTPVNGWTSITNSAGALFTGNPEETDGDLRVRRAKSTTLGAVNIFSAMTAALSAVTGVTDAKVLVNETGVTDALGLPLKSYRGVVEGGADDDIAQALWDKHPAGIATSGASSGTATTSTGPTRVMNFDRPTYINIFVEMTLTTTADYPSDGDAQIQQALVDYAAGQLAGYEDQGFKIGDDVEYSRLYAALNSVPGHTVNSFFIGLATLPTGTANISITDLQKSAWSITRIVVN